MRRTRSGFSFFETILYLALFSLLAVTLFRFSFDAFGLGIKDRISRHVFSDARFVTSRMNSILRNAAGIDTGGSVWNDPDGKVVLEQVGSSDTVTISIENGRVTLTETGHPGVTLHSSESKVRELTFQKYGSREDGSEYVGFVLKLESAANDTAAPAEYGVITTLRGGAFIRNSGIGL